MFQLPTGERHLFIAVIVIFLISSALAVRQIHRSDEKIRRILISLVALAVSLQSVILLFRSVAIQAIPLTGLFESMIVLSVTFGLTFLFLNIAIRQVWFSSVMIWFVTVLVCLSAFVASPASQLYFSAKIPWIIFHGLSMAFSGAAIAFSAALAVLFLLTRRNLKRKTIGKVLGKMPNIEKLEHLNVIGIKASFVLLTFGLVSGIGLAVVTSEQISLTFHDWITDSKIILVSIAWVVLVVTLGLRHVLGLRGRVVARMTLIACFLIIFAIIGSTIFCGTEHGFSSGHIEAVDSRGQQ